MEKQTRGRDKFNKVKKPIMFISSLFKVLPLSIRIKLFEFFRMSKGSKGILIRYILLKSIATACGDNVSIGPSVYLLRPELLSIGDNVSIHPMSYIDATGKITIKDDVSIAHVVTIMSSTHNYNDINIPFKDQGYTLSETVIENDVWVGAKATILAGLTIGHGSIIGASAVVTKDVEDYTVVGGIPAKVIKSRK